MFDGTTISYCNSSNNWAAASSGFSQWSNGNSGAIYYNGGSVGIGTTAPSNTLTISGTEGLPFGTNYSTAGTQSDVSIGSTASSMRYSGASAATFNGIVAGSSGQLLYLHNGSTSTLTLANQATADTTVANQIVTGTGANLSMAANSAVTLQYDPTATNSGGATGAWRVIGGSGSGGSSGGGSGTTWVMIASTDIASAATSYTFSGLAGDTDQEYQVVGRIVGGSGSATTYSLQPNGDAASTDYDDAYLSGSNSGAAGGFSTGTPGMYIGYTSGANQLTWSTMTIYAKSGSVRSYISTQPTAQSGATTNSIQLVGGAWTNTSAQITSMAVVANQTNGLGVGTHLELWAKRSIGGSGGTPAGTSTNVQFNNNGALGGDSGFTYAGSSGAVTITGNLGLGTTTPASTLSVNGTAGFLFGADYTTTGSQSDVAVNTSSSARYNGTAVATFYGILAGSNGQILNLHNASAYALTLSNQSASESTAANKIITGTGSDLVIAANSSAMLQYDTTAARWRVIGGSGGSSAGGGGTTWVMIASTDIASAATSYTFSGLAGDTDGEYQIIADVVAGSTSSTCYSVNPNADMSTSDYGVGQIQGAGSTASASAETSGLSGLNIGYTSGSGTLNLSSSLLYAKSGRTRILGALNSQQVSGTSLGSVNFTSSSWNNTVNAITSLQITASNCSGTNVSGGLGVGTHLELWAKRSIGGSGGTPAGTSTNVQFNNNGALGGDSGFTYAGSSGAVTIAGHVGIGTTSPTAELQVYGANGNAASGTPLFRLSDTNLSGSYFAVDNGTTASAYRILGISRNIELQAGSNSYQLVLNTSGNVGIQTTSPSYTLQVNGSVAGTSAYNNTSDFRLKKNIQPIPYGLDTVMRLRPISFDWKDQSQAWKRRHQLGLVAQEVEPVVPEVVTVADDKMRTRSLAYGELVPVLIKAIQDLEAANDKEAVEINALRTRVDALEATSH